MPHGLNSDQWEADKSPPPPPPHMGNREDLPESLAKTISSICYKAVLVQQGFLVLALPLLTVSVFFYPNCCFHWNTLPNKELLSSSVVPNV